MGDTINITLLVDNEAPAGLLADHGFAAWIDTGQGSALAPSIDLCTAAVPRWFSGDAGVLSGRGLPGKWMSFFESMRYRFVRKLRKAIKVLDWRALRPSLQRFLTHLSTENVYKLPPSDDRIGPAS